MNFDDLRSSAPTLHRRCLSPEKNIFPIPSKFISCRRLCLVNEPSSIYIFWFFFLTPNLAFLYPLSYYIVFYNHIFPLLYAFAIRVFVYIDVNYRLWKYIFWNYYSFFKDHIIYQNVYFRCVNVSLLFFRLLYFFYFAFTQHECTELYIHKALLPMQYYICFIGYIYSYYINRLKHY